MIQNKLVISILMIIDFEQVLKVCKEFLIQNFQFIYVQSYHEYIIQFRSVHYNKQNYNLTFPNSNIRKKNFMKISFAQNEQRNLGYTKIEEKLFI